MVKGLEKLNALKNEAELITRDGKYILKFKKPVQISDTEKHEEFIFRPPTLSDIEIALDSASGTDALSQAKQMYHLVSSQFGEGIGIIPSDVPKYMTPSELGAFNEVLTPFLS